MVAGVGERAFARPCLGVDFLFPKLKGAAPDIDFQLKLAQTLAGGVVVVRRGLAGEFQRALPKAIREGRDFAWHAGERRRVALDARA